MTDPLLKRSKEELVAIIREMLRQEPDLDYILDSAPPGLAADDTPFDATPYEARLSAAADWDSREYIEDVGYNILQTAHAYRKAHNYTAALTLYETVLKTLVTIDYGMFDHYKDSPQMWEVFSEAAEGLDALLVQSAFVENDEYRNRALFSLLNIILYDVNIGGVDLAYDPDCEEIILQVARPPDAARLKKAVDHAAAEHRKTKYSNWAVKQLSSLSADLDVLQGADVDTVINNLLEQDMILPAISRMLQAGQVERAEKLAREADPNNVGQLSIVQTFAAAGHQEKALSLGEHFYKDFDPRTSILNDWLAGQHEEAGNLERALDIRLNDLYRIYRLNYYKDVRRIAKKLERWDEVYQQITQHFSQQSDFLILLELAMQEKDWSTAWDILPKAKGGYNSRRLALTLAEKDGSNQPEAAIDIYLREVEAYIGYKNRDSYKTAASYLKQARPLYKQLGKSEDFEEFVALIRAEYPRHRALQDELNKAGL